MLGLAGRLSSTRRRTRALAALGAAFLLALGGGAAWHYDRPVAVAAPAPPLALTGRVVDDAGILDPADRAALADKLALLENQSGPQVVVASTPSLKGMKIEDYSLRLARGWGLGDKKRNDGVLILVAPNERFVRIEVGKGLEKTLTDPDCAEIISSKMLPQFRRGDLRAGTLAGVQEVIDKLRAHPTKVIT